MTNSEQQIEADKHPVDLESAAATGDTDSNHDQQSRSTTDASSFNNSLAARSFGQHNHHQSSEEEEEVDVESDSGEGSPLVNRREEPAPVGWA